MTLSWNASTGATGYRLYGAEGTAPFAFNQQTAGTTATALVSTNAVTRFYVTAFNSVGESGPSNTITNTPPPAGAPILVLTAPVMSATNLVPGQSVTLSAMIRNDGAGDLVLVDGALTLLPPGATRVDGPYVHVSAVAPQTLQGHTATVINGTWITLPTNGTWNAYIVVKDSAGTWTASTFTPFNVSSTPIPTVPLPPTGLQVTPVTSTRLDISWAGTMTASTELERSKETEAFKRIATVSPGTMHYIDSIQRRRDYRYRARSRNSAGVSDYSNTAIYTP